MNRGRVRVEDGQKRVRVYLGGEVVADSTNVKLVWEKPYYPVYYFPEADVRVELLPHRSCRTVTEPGHRRVLRRQERPPSRREGGLPAPGFASGRASLSGRFRMGRHGRLVRGG